MLLAKLAIHYYRQDFNENHAKSIIADMVTDLAEFDISDIAAAIEAYRREPQQKGKGKFFPDSGTLRGLAGAERRDRLAKARAAQDTRQGERRPIMWWLQQKALWQTHWREGDIPLEHQTAFHKLKAIATAKASYPLVSDGPEF